jgi:hypothetical protein
MHGATSWLVGGLHRLNYVAFVETMWTVCVNLFRKEEEIRQAKPENLFHSIGITRVFHGYINQQRHKDRGGDVIRKICLMSGLL